MIPLFIRGSEHDPRTKTPVTDEHVPNRPIGHRPEPQVKHSITLMSCQWLVNSRIFFFPQISSDIPLFSSPLLSSLSAVSWSCSATNGRCRYHEHQWTAKCTIWGYVLYCRVWILPFPLRPTIPGQSYPSIFYFISPTILFPLSFSPVHFPFLSVILLM